MTNKSTKSALLTSSISLLLCFAMLLGTTFAWFTDNVATTNNIITAGNLDVELYYLNDETDDWTKVDANTNVFKADTLWEPGHTEVVKLKVVNEGTLDLEYQLGVNIASEIGSVNVAGDEFKLSDYIKYAIVEGDQTYSDSASAAAAVDATANKLNVAYDSGVINLENGTDKIVTVVVYMPTTVGNEANYGKNQAIPTITLGINLYSTQLNSEKDSFGADYDENAKYDKPAPTVEVTSVEELTEALSNVTEEVVIDAQGVTIDLIAAEPYGIPAGVTLKGVTFNANYRGINYVMYEDGPGEQVVFENCSFGNTSRIITLGGEVDGPDSVVYKNCTFKGQVLTNFVDNTAGVAEFNNCTFTKSASGIYHYIEAMGGTHNFNDCTFDYTGVNQTSMGVITSGQLNVYSEDEYSTVVNLTNCTRTNCGIRKYGPNSTLNY